MTDTTDTPERRAWREALEDPRGWVVPADPAFTAHLLALRAAADASDGGAGDPLPEWRRQRQEARLRWLANNP